MKGISVPNGTEFPSSRGKEQFLAQLDRVKRSLISKRMRSMDHLELLSYLLDLAEKFDQSEEQLILVLLHLCSILQVVIK